MKKKKTIKRKTNVIPSVDNKIWVEYKASTASSNINKLISYVKDYTIIEDQKETSACVGYSLATGIYRDYLIANNIINKKETLSPEYLWIASKETDRFTNYPTTFLDMSGTSIQTALDVLRKYGSPTNQEFTKLSKTLEEQDFYQVIAKTKIKSYYKVTDYHTHLLTKGALVAAIWMTNSFLNAKKDIVLSSDFGERQGGHAVCLYGVDNTIPTRPLYLIKNSWGKSWADGGYVWVDKGFLSRNLIECFGII